MKIMKDADDVLIQPRNPQGKPDPEGTNLDRAKRALGALRAYWGNESDQEPFETALSDLMCDLRHLAWLGRIPYDRAQERAHDNFLEEREREDEYRDAGPN